MSICEMVKTLKWYYLHNMRSAYFSVQYPVIYDEVEGGRSAKYELILTTRFQYQEGRSAGRSRCRSAKFEFIVTTRCQYQGGRSAKVQLIMTTRCQYWGVDLLADLPKFNSS